MRTTEYCQLASSYNSICLLYDTIGKPSPHLKTFEEAKKDYEGFFKAGETLSKNPIAPFYYMLGERAYPDITKNGGIL